MSQHKGLDPKQLLPYIEDYSAYEAGAIFGISASIVNLWRNGKRRVGLYTADKIACQMGIHPILIWGDEYVKELEIPPSYILKSNKLRGSVLRIKPPGPAQGDRILRPVLLGGR